MMEYPELIQIETTQVCNGHCPWCRHEPSHKRLMTDDVFMAILNQLKQWQVPPKRIYPFITGEPFSDQRMERFCKLINTTFPNTELGFNTNVSLITPDTIRWLKTIKNIINFSCSFESFSPLFYRDVLKLDFGRVFRGMLLLTELQLPLNIVRVNHPASEPQDVFLSKCAALFPNVKVVCNQPVNWINEIQSPIDLDSTLDRPCPRRGHVSIIADGRIALCCLDNRGDYAIGHVAKDNILELFNTPAMVNARKTFKRYLTPCNQCNQVR